MIRFFTKAFKEELEIRPEDEAVLRRLIAEFDPKAEMSEQNRNWIEKNAKKLFQHASSIEYATQILDRYGLREKLIALGDPKAEGSMAWWLNRKPLASFEVGHGPLFNPAKTAGATAAELGITEVSHATRVLAYESIMRAPTGYPNALVSRTDAKGETAAHGEGYYTRTGDRGAWEGITIHHKVDPKARENVDFSIFGDYVLFHNRKALQVVPESLDITALGAMKMLSKEIDPTRDLALIEMIRRRLKAHAIKFRPEEIAPAIEMIRTQAQGEAVNSLILEIWMGSEESLKHPELVDVFLKNPKTVKEFLEAFRRSPQWLRHPKAGAWLAAAAPLPQAMEPLLHLRESPHWSSIENGTLATALSMESFEFSVSRLLRDAFLRRPLSDYTTEHRALIEAIARKGIVGADDVQGLTELIAGADWFGDPLQDEVLELIRVHAQTGKAKKLAAKGAFFMVIESARHGKPPPPDALTKVRVFPLKDAHSYPWIPVEWVQGLTIPQLNTLLDLNSEKLNRALLPALAHSPPTPQMRDLVLRRPKKLPRFFLIKCLLKNCGGKIHGSGPGLWKFSKPGRT